MGRKILAVASGLVTAWGFLLIVKMIATDVGWNTPNNLEFMSRGERAAYFSGQLVGVYATLLVGSMIAAFFGEYIVTKMSGRESPGISLSLVTGAALILTGLANFFLFLPGQPAWLVVATLASYIPVTLLGHYAAAGFGPRRLKLL